MAFAFVAICQRFECSPKAMELATQSTKSIDFIADLRSENLGQDAVQALSRMMPKEQAVDWAEQSARMAGEEGGLSPDEVKALDAAKAWSLNPTEEGRAAAAEAAGRLPANSPAMWAANAAAYSNRAGLPEGGAQLAAADDLTAHMAAGSVQLSAAKLSPAGIPDLVMSETPQMAEKIPELSEMSNGLEIPEMPEIPKMPDIPSIPKAPTMPDVQKAAIEQAKALTPEQQAEMMKQLNPFLDLGIKIAGLMK